MNKIDTEGIQPMAHPQDIKLRLRDDEVKEVNKRDQFQAIAPAVNQGLYLVPKVID
jgi:aspartyl-tRNA(Asn)/glutamyl-tRNA(Gln) amidotransferase subunit C